MQAVEVLIPIIFFLSTAAVLAVYLFTRHRERVLMIDKGMQSDEIKAMYARRWFKANPLGSLKWGMLFVGIGLAALLGIWLRENYVFNDGVIPGMMTLFGGIALILFYVVARRKEGDGD
ncbi:MAG: DUF6249 domain-containing protein [Bacteroidota bacterium]